MLRRHLGSFFLCGGGLLRSASSFGVRRLDAAFVPPDARQGTAFSRAVRAPTTPTVIPNPVAPSANGGEGSAFSFLFFFLFFSLPFLCGVQSSICLFFAKYVTT
jgi:hypothetical protein